LTEAQGRIFRLEKWSRAVGTVLTVERKLQNFLFHLLQTDQSIARNAGQKEEVRGSNARPKPKSPPQKGLFGLKPSY